MIQKRPFPRFQIVVDTDGETQMDTTTLDFSLSVQTSIGFEESLDLLRKKLQRESFWVVSEVRCHRKFEREVGLRWRKYTVLTVCSPFLAYFDVVVAADVGSTLIATTNHSWAGPNLSSIGTQVLARELHRKLRQIFAELPTHEIAVNYAH